MGQGGAGRGRAGCLDPGWSRWTRAGPMDQGGGQWDRVGLLDPGQSLRDRAGPMGEGRATGPRAGLPDTGQGYWTQGRASGPKVEPMDQAGATGPWWGYWTQGGADGTGWGQWTKAGSMREGGTTGPGGGLLDPGQGQWTQGGAYGLGWGHWDRAGLLDPWGGQQERAGPMGLGGASGPRAGPVVPAGVVGGACRGGASDITAVVGGDWPRGGYKGVEPRGGALGWGRAGHTHGRALGQLVGCHHLHVEVLGLGLAPGLHQPLQHLGQEKVARGGRRDPTCHRLAPPIPPRHSPPPAPGSAPTLGEVILM